MLHRHWRALAIAISVALLLPLMAASPSEAHSDNTTKGSFAGSKREGSLWSIAEDTNQDGHCVYMVMWHERVRKEGVKSCGPRNGNLKPVSNISGGTSYYGATTGSGHWDSSKRWVGWIGAGGWVEKNW